MRRRKVRREKAAARGVRYEVAPHPTPGCGFVVLATVDGVDIRPPTVSSLVLFPVDYRPPWWDEC